MKHQNSEYVVHAALIGFFIMCMLGLFSSCTHQPVQKKSTDVELQQAFILGYSQGSMNGCLELMDMIEAEPATVCEKISFKQTQQLDQLMKELR